ncbi:hypothetical protein ALC56_03906 [Trachymyrmex septentrionalis]|uniref:Uncharacterized protein n=1 Tax=Trachymyrmex septentrionalis TaxID=34720 RepID=A0A151JZW0_9HYME|nr:hypothetical protein ALC56_03906 [Trachymyrmex septentrionalis]
MADVRERVKIARAIEKTSESIRKKHRTLKIGRIEERIALELPINVRGRRKKNKRREKKRARRSSVSRLCINPMIDRTVMYVPVTSISRAKIVPTIETLENVFETMEDSEDKESSIDLRRVVAKRGNWKNRKKLLVQRGGFLPIIIGPILSTLLSLIIERHYGNTYGLSEKREDRKKIVRNENENANNNATRDASDDNETTNDDVFHDLTQTSDIPSPLHSNSNTDITAKNFEISSEHNHMMKSIEEILERVPKSYRKHAHLLMKHLLQKAVPDKLSLDEHGIVTIDGNVVKDSNIAVLINEAREKPLKQWVEISLHDYSVC